MDPLMLVDSQWKTTKSRLRLKFVMLMWLKKNETDKTEGAKGGDSLEVTKKGAHMEFGFG